jgi:hypothetical protein
MAPRARSVRPIRLVLAFALVAVLVGCTGASGAMHTGEHRSSGSSAAGTAAPSPAGALPRVDASSAGFHLAAPVERQVAVADGGTIYLAGGLDGTVYLIGGWDGTTYQRDILATRDGTTFRVIGRLPVGLRYPAVAAAGGAVAIAGGEGPGGTSAAVYRLDPSTGRVRRIGALPEPVAHASAFAVDGIVYVPGGVDAAGRAVRTVTGIDPSSGQTWPAGTLPRPVSDAAVASDGSGRAWLLGGDRGRAVSDVETVHPAPGGRSRSRRPCSRTPARWRARAAPTRRSARSRVSS